MIVEALQYQCQTSECPASAKPFLIRYRPDYLYQYHPGDLPAGVEHRERESDDPRNTALDGFVLESGLFCTACGVMMTRVA